MTGTSKLGDEVTRAFIRTTGTRYCAHCEMYRPAADFVQVKGRRTRCKACAAKASQGRRK